MKSIFSLVVLSISVSSEGLPLAGTTGFTLVCSFVLQSPLTVLNSMWVDANNTVVPAASSIMMQGMTGNVTAQFSELASSDSGLYTCVLDIQNGDAVEVIRRSLNVTVEGKIVYSTGDIMIKCH